MSDFGEELPAEGVADFLRVSTKPTLGLGSWVALHRREVDLTWRVRYFDLVAYVPGGFPQGVAAS